MNIIRKGVDKNDEQTNNENNLATFTKVMLFLHQ